MESVFVLLLFLELLLTCACVTLMETIGEACEQQHDGIECADTSRDELQRYTGVRDDANARKIDVTADTVERYQ